MSTAINKTSHKYIKKEPDGHGGINHDITRTSGSEKASKQGLVNAMNKNVQNGGGREAAQKKGSKINVDTAKRMAGGYSAGLYNPLNTRILSTQTNKAFKKAKTLLNNGGGREAAQAKGAKINAAQNRNTRNNGGGREAAQKKGSKINKKSKLQIAMLRGAKKFRSM